MNSFSPLRWVEALTLREFAGTLANWLAGMRTMIGESSLGASPNGTQIVREAGKVQELIESFGANLNRRPIERLVKDLVMIRRRSNRVALDVYLRTFDNRWPQTSVQLGVVVERVQRACLSNIDRAAMMVLNSPTGAANRHPLG